MRSNSAWAANNNEDRRTDLVQTLRSPLALAAAVVVVAVVVVSGLLDGERWVEAGPIAVVQEEEVLYLDEEGIFVFWNQGEPYGVMESVDEGSQPMSFCEASGTFLGPAGEVYDQRGRALHGREVGLPLLPARMDGHLVSVSAERSSGSPEPSPASSATPDTLCSRPDTNGRGLLSAP